jgi:hypothetical protein
MQLLEALDAYQRPFIQLAEDAERYAASIAFTVPAPQIPQLREPPEHHTTSAVLDLTDIARRQDVRLAELVADREAAAKRERETDLRVQHYQRQMIVVAFLAAIVGAVIAPLVPVVLRAL